MRQPSSQRNDDLTQLEALRALQKREAARGCLLALVFEGAALLAVGLWIIAAALEMPRLQTAALGGFIVFSFLALVMGLILLIQGNQPKQRRLRREHEAAARRRGRAGGETVVRDPPTE